MGVLQDAAPSNPKQVSNAAVPLRLLPWNKVGESVAAAAVVTCPRSLGHRLLESASVDRLPGSWSILKVRMPRGH